jgi:CRISPR-associated protein Csx17
VLLAGVQSQPLASYLTALGVLRIVSLRRGNSILGRFSPRGFELWGIEASELVDLLLDEWEPSPVLTPWNNASGFYASSKGQLAADAMRAIIASGLPRLAKLRSTIERVRQVVTTWDLKEAPDGEAKARFIGHLRSILSDEAIEWLDAVAAVDDQDVRMMPLLGSGGNEGVLDYSGLFLRSLCDTILGDRDRSARQLEAALFGATSQDLLERPGGQFDPGTAGGFNTGPGFESKGLPNNPWAFLLLVEGTLTWASGLASRQEGLATGYRFAVSPFTVRHRAAGYGSAGRNDDDPQRVRAEVWVPLWERPTTLVELTRFIAEGRVEVAGRRRKVTRASDSMDFVDAVSLLGVDRGVNAFVRYVFIKRRGESYIALPAGTVTVGYRPEAELLRQLDGELDLVDQFFSRFQGQDGPPALLQGLRRAIDDARYAATIRGGDQAMRRVVRAIGALEMALSRRDPGKEPRLHRPLGGLKREWIAACGDSTVIRLAAALASIRKTGGAPEIRAYLTPLDPGKPSEYAPGLRTLGWSGMNVPDRIANALHHRLLDVRARKSDEEEKVRGRNPTWGARIARLQDIAAFLSPELFGHQELRELEELVFGFCWIDFRQRGGIGIRPPPVEIRAVLPRSYALLKLLFLPNELAAKNTAESHDKLWLTPDASIVPLLRAGRISDAVAVATRQLAAKGLRPRKVVAEGAPDDLDFGQRLAAALLVPVGGEVLPRLALWPDENSELRTSPDNQEMIDAR